MKAKYFEDLLPGEVKKAERAANKALHTHDCKVTGYSCKISRPFDFAPKLEVVEAICEICHGYERRAEVDVFLDINMADRRRTRATVIEQHSAGDPIPVKHGRWVISSDGYYPYCSECKQTPEDGVRAPYCPFCHARMDGGTNGGVKK